MSCTSITCVRQFYKPLLTRSHLLERVHSAQLRISRLIQQAGLRLEALSLPVIRIRNAPGDLLIIRGLPRYLYPSMNRGTVHYRWIALFLSLLPYAPSCLSIFIFFSRHTLHYSFSSWKIIVRCARHIPAASTDACCARPHPGTWLIGQSDHRLRKKGNRGTEELPVAGLCKRTPLEAVRRYRLPTNYNATCEADLGISVWLLRYRAESHETVPIPKNT